MTPEELDEELTTDVAWVLGTLRGRRLMQRIAYERTLGMLLCSPRVPGDEALTHQNVGRQDFARDILALCERVAPELFDTAMREAHEAGRRTSRSLVPREGDASP